ncbi:MAG: TIGR01777 family oxidoreductase [Sedimentisphaerales bacterium]|nr:TIGR01777 family oxidoreductase [Sedimentisphaerales bacterium]
MRIVIAGATGFIGKRLCSKLSGNYEVTTLARDINKANKLLGGTIKAVKWDAKTPCGWKEAIEGAFAVVSLAGENITGRWTRKKKSRILQSRIDSTRAIIEAVKKAVSKPKTVVLASAIGYYSPQTEKELDEDCGPGEGFLADVCRKVESFAQEIDSYGVRCVVLRTGVVLGLDGGVLARFMTPFNFFMGGWPGDGTQWFSWISIEDEVEAIKFLIEHENLKGVFNLTAPQPVRMKEFCKILAEVMNRPCLISIPAFILRLAYSQMADEAILSGQKVTPKRLLQAGYNFRYKDVKLALRDIIKERR